MILKKTHYDIEVERQVGDYLQWVVHTPAIALERVAIRTLKIMQEKYGKSSKFRLVEVTRKIIKV